MFAPNRTRCVFFKLSFCSVSIWEVLTAISTGFRSFCDWYPTFFSRTELQVRGQTRDKMNPNLKRFENGVVKRV